jgi:hypothetical protein
VCFQLIHIAITWPSCSSEHAKSRFGSTAFPNGATILHLGKAVLRYGGLVVSPWGRKVCPLSQSYDRVFSNEVNVPGLRIIDPGRMPCSCLFHSIPKGLKHNSNSSVHFRSSCSQAFVVLRGIVTISKKTTVTLFLRSMRERLHDRHDFLDKSRILGRTSAAVPVRCTGQTRRIISPFGSPTWWALSDHEPSLVLPGVRTVKSQMTSIHNSLSGNQSGLILCE